MITLNSEKFYSSKEVADRLSIQPVTVRKYSQLLEDKGYIFNRDEKGWRRYSKNDLQALKHLINLKSDGKSVDESVDVVAHLYHSNLSILPTDTTLQEENSLKLFMENQMEFNKEILERLDQQEQFQEKLIQRLDERDKNLMIALNQSLETQKQIASTKEKKWWRFWR